MSKSESNVIAFRLPKSLKEEAEKRAKQNGQKNANEWCRKLAANELAKENDEAQLEKELQLSAVDNVRQLVINCFELILGGTQKNQEFREIVSASNDDWKQITETQESQLKFPEYSSLIDEVTNEMTDLFSGEKLIVKEEILNRTSSSLSEKDNTASLTEINRVDNSPVQ